MVCLLLCQVFALPAAPMLPGVVVDEQGRPVPNAVIQKYEPEDESETPPRNLSLKGEISTDNEGKFELELARTGSVLVVYKPGVALTWAVYPNMVASNQVLRLVLNRPGTISGIVRDESGRPVPNATVSVRLAVRPATDYTTSPHFSELSGTPARKFFSARTDATGRFVIDNLPPDAAVDLTVEARGLVLRRDAWPSVLPETMPYRTGDKNIELVLEPAACIEGKVVSATDGRPLAGVPLLLRPENPDFPDPSETGPVRTDTAGRFRFENLYAGSYYIHSFSTPGHIPDVIWEPAFVQVTRGTPQRDVEIRAYRPGVIEATVVTRRGHTPGSVPRVHVTCGWFETTVPVSGERPVLVPVPPGEYEITVSSDLAVFDRVSTTAVPGQTNRVRLQIPEPVILSGTVRIPDGFPAAQAQITLIGLDPGPTRRSVTTDAEGRFKIDTLPVHVHKLRDVACLLARDPGRNLAAAHELHIHATNYELRLEPAVTITGRVISEGSPVTNVAVTLVFWVGNAGVYVPGMATTTNDPSGRIEIRALPPRRKYDVVVSAPGYGRKTLQISDTMTIPGTLDLGQIELKRARFTLAGTVLDLNGKPVPGVYMNLYGEEQPEAYTRTDRRGRFQFTNVCEGTIRIVAYGRGVTGSVTAEAGSTDVVVRLGESDGAQLPKPKELTGRITTPDDKPASGVEIFVLGTTIVPGQNFTKTGPSGTFRLQWIKAWDSTPPHVVARDQNRNLTAICELNEDTTNVNLRLTPGLIVAGRVQDPAGKPISRAIVSAQIRLNRYAVHLEPPTPKTDADGRFQLSAIPPDAEPMLQVWASGYGRVTIDLARDAHPGGSIALPPIVLKPANRRLAGRVLDQNNNPVSDSHVFTLGNNQPHEMKRTDPEGRFEFAVCEGSVDLIVTAPTGSGSLTVQAGDTNVQLVLQSRTGRGVATRRARSTLVGKQLPELTAFGIPSTAVPTGTPVLVCVFDPDQRPSRRCIRALIGRYLALKEQNIAVVAIQAVPTTPEAVKSWKEVNAVPFPVGFFQERSDKTTWINEIGEVPWLILADGQGRVVAEGFAVEELDEKTAALKN